MKILVTGAGGFIGSHLVERCLAEGAEVVAFVRYNGRDDRGWLCDVGDRPRLSVIAGDIRDFDSVRAAVTGCDVVFHLAALIGIPYSYRSPLAYIQTNVVGTYNVLEAARQAGTGQVLVTSTSETYGTAQTVPIDETHPAVGQSPYAASKIAADQLAISYHRSFGMQVKIMRPFNTYGPRQSARAIVPTVLAQVLAGRERVEVGSLAPTRDLTYVTDTVAGFWALAQHDGCWGEPVNLGTGRDCSIGDLVARILALCGVRCEVVATAERVRPPASEVMRLVCDAGRLAAATGWQPRVDLDTGLRLTRDWLASRLDLYAPQRYGV